MRAAWAAIAATIALCTVGAAGEATANIYKCKDASGKISFVDQPCPTGEATVDHKVTNDRNTLGGKSSSARAKDAKDAKDAKSDARTSAAPASAPAASGDSGCQKQRERYARMQSESCIKGIHMLTGKVSCMSDQQRREYLENFKSTLEAVCS